MSGFLLADIAGMRCVGVIEGFAINILRVIGQMNPDGRGKIVICSIRHDRPAFRGWDGKMLNAWQTFCLRQINAGVSFAGADRVPVRQVRVERQPVRLHAAPAQRVRPAAASSIAPATVVNLRVLDQSTPSAHRLYDDKCECGRCPAIERSRSLLAP